MPVEVLLELIIKIAVLTALGYLLRKIGMITDGFQKGMSDMLMFVIIPCSVLATANTPKQQGMALNLLWAALLVLAYYAVSFALTSLLAKGLSPGPNRGVFIALSVFANVGFIGFPIVQSLYGAEGMLYTVIANLAFQFAMFSVGVRLYGGRDVDFLHFVRQPNIILLLLGVVLFLLPVSLPGPLVSTLDLVGNMSAPFSMFVVGSALAQIKFSSILTSKRAWLVTLLRQLVFPLLSALVFYAMGLKGVLPSTLVMLTSLPAATLNVIFAEKYGADVPFATRAVSQGTLVMLISLPLTATLCGVLF